MSDGTGGSEGKRARGIMYVAGSRNRVLDRLGPAQYEVHVSGVSSTTAALQVRPSHIIID